MGEDIRVSIRAMDGGATDGGAMITRCLTQRRVKTVLYYKYKFRLRLRQILYKVTIYIK
jgi:hypothetical protein